MKMILPKNIAKDFDIDSIIFKKDYNKGIIIFMKVTSVSYYGFKQSKTHTKFGGYIVDKKPLR